MNTLEKTLDNFELIDGTKLKRIAIEVFGEQKAKHLINGGWIVPGTETQTEPGKWQKKPLVSWSSDDGYFVDYQKHIENNYLMNGFAALAVICGQESGFGAVDFDDAPIIDPETMQNANVKTARSNGHHIWFENRGGYYRGQTKGYDILADKCLCYFYSEVSPREVLSNKIVFTIEEIASRNHLDLKPCIKSSPSTLPLRIDGKNIGKNVGKNVYETAVDEASCVVLNTTQAESALERAHSLGFDVKVDWIKKNRISSMKGAKEGRRKDMFWHYSCQFVSLQIETGELKAAAMAGGLTESEVEEELESAKQYVDLGMYIQIIDYCMGWRERVDQLKGLGQAQQQVIEFIMTAAIEQNDLAPSISQLYVAEQLGLKQPNVNAIMKSLHLVKGIIVPKENGYKPGSSHKNPFNYQLSWERQPINKVLDHDEYLMKINDERNAWPEPVRSNPVEVLNTTTAEPRTATTVISTATNEISDRDRREYTRWFYDNGGDGLSLEDFIQKCHREAKELDW
ncbi:hypothetical protein QM797_10185 [Rhodococcus sp. IEGM 1381]|uniref:hypothetical protein n=1 Tax=Rhodococcus sp. IEGM 1381 TaxID=3047085 RepID=UPI0024B63F42|nr:hypothetical protein [Rhodococcus sp. IEGM 1381]MDI9895094.1 hypothetical protein [Rhodococcus sp. IEGM 1381]